MKILPFDFAETCRYFKNFTAEESAYVYGIVGGTPQYLLQMNDKLSIEDNIKNTFLNPSSALFEEPENLLKQEVPELPACQKSPARWAKIPTFAPPI